MSRMEASRPTACFTLVPSFGHPFRQIGDAEVRASFLGEIRRAKSRRCVCRSRVFSVAQ